MLPDGLAYLDSWVDEHTLGRCFQLMETEDPDLFGQWVANWSDLVEFEIVPSSARARLPRGRSAERCGRSGRDA
jgi:hypothetical protein